ncbi:hypothetical protein MKZ38_003563 [Zalerion maritima]|uniref:SET domain-containing protein n=1 Tax=Zalerion maritima TaxID=339359 RepID=A0AAD5RP38_9PEZI|nr:hypothetical protein MKZ38_003563 [Zalerion maritima]
MEAATKRHFMLHGKNVVPAKDMEKCHFCQLRSFPTHADSPVSIVNHRDDATFPAGFQFINESITREGVAAADEDFLSGCQCTDDKRCQYGKCECLDEVELPDGHPVPHNGKRYAYHTHGIKKGLLRSSYLTSRAPIYECHPGCACSSECPNRVVERGRTLPLQIFRTDNRGWGVRSSVDIRRGQFIDRYLGEVITSDEADARRRQSNRAQRKDVYLFALDKFLDEASPDARLQGPPLEVDGEFMSGPTRFINHSCDPNLRIFARVGDHANKHMHDLALFAVRDVPRGAELTFDYVDGVEEGKMDANDKALRAPIMSQINNSLARRVLAIPELRELILAHVPDTGKDGKYDEESVLQLKKLERVCKNFKTTINTSHTIQTHLFLRPSDGGRTGPTGSSKGMMELHPSASTLLRYYTDGRPKKVEPEWQLERFAAAQSEALVANGPPIRLLSCWSFFIFNSTSPAYVEPLVNIEYPRSGMRFAHVTSLVQKLGAKINSSPSGTLVDLDRNWMQGYPVIDMRDRARLRVHETSEEFRKATQRQKSDTAFLVVTIRRHRKDWSNGDPGGHQWPRKLRDVYFYCGRWYGKDGNSQREKYIFPIDEEETNRLDIFHKFFLEARNDSLFSASLDVKKPLRVLDLGTGTGIRAVELSEKYPHMHVQGLDFNMIQPEMIPRTMEPPEPFDLEGSWDTVGPDWDFMHARTLFGSIRCWPDMHKQMIRHLKPGTGYMEQVEVDWVPRCDDDSLPPDSTLSQWASKLLDAIDQYGRPMRVHPEEARRQLALAGFVDISEAVIRACHNSWPEDPNEKEAGRWFNLGLSNGLTALSYAAMVRMLGMSKEEVESLCARANREICLRDTKGYKNDDGSVIDEREGYRNFLESAAEEVRTKLHLDLLASLLGWTRRGGYFELLNNKEKTSMDD